MPKMNAKSKIKILHYLIWTLEIDSECVREREKKGERERWREREEEKNNET